MSEQQWREIDAYNAGALGGEDAALEAARSAVTEAGMPAIEVTAMMGKLLHLLVRVSGARRVLEIGTLGGYSSIWMARALPAGGSLLSLELSEDHARVARASIERAGVGDLVEVRVGPALKALDALRGDAVEPFDLVFVDADKPSIPAYVEAAIALGRPGTVIVVDNVVRGGSVARGESDDASQGVRRFMETFGGDPRLTATALQTVGGKGHDGFVVAVVNAEA